jgi:two-component system, LytTR family, sensor histidine kinase AlgZ
MHPILARPGRLVAYIAIWLPLGILLAALLALQGVFAWTEAILVAVPLAVAYGFLCLSAWYVTGGAPVDRAGALRVAVSAVASSFMSSAVWLLIARAWLGVIASFGRWPDVASVFRLAAPTLFGFGFLLYLLAMAASYLAAAFNVSRDAERRGLELQVLAREAELRALRAQIDPHFLYNSLNSISALTGRDPAGARRMCLLLGEFLRKTLNLSALQRLPLAEELALVDRFLDIEQVRFGSRLQVARAVDERALRCLVPPLILQPLIENAVAHGIAGLLAGGVISLSVERRGERLSIAIENPCDPDPSARPSPGVGLENVRRRLETTFGRAARLETRSEPTRFRVDIDLPWIEP